jgi:hypothetical protein
MVKKKSDAMTEIKRIPHRIFLDTGVVHYLFRYGDIVFDNVELSACDRLHGVPGGVADLQALRAFCFMNQRNAFELAVSENSLKEVLGAGDCRYTSWLLELAGYWQGIALSYEGSPCTRAGLIKQARVMGGRLGYLSRKDRALIADACKMECDTFLTVDRRLARNAEPLSHELDISVVRPATLLERLQPWAGLFP